MPENAPTAGAVLAGRYTLGEVIGRGGMAEVYRGWDRVLDRPVAVKTLHLVAPDAADRARFAREASTLAKLTHPNLVTVLDAGTLDDRPFLVMELVDGAPLSACLHGGALDARYVAAAGAQVADALRYVHEKGIVHRDVTPANILLVRDGRVLLTDFGIARLAGDTARLTRQGMMIGTPAYLAPEQVRGDDVGAAADVYALGLTLVEALTGAPVYQGPATEAALARLSAPPPIPNDLPAPWPDLLRRMTALDPAQRPSAADVATALTQAATGLDPATATIELLARPTPTRPLPVPAATAVEPHGEDPRVRGSMLRASVVRNRWPAARPTAFITVLVGIIVAVMVAVIMAIDAGQQKTTVGIPPNLPPQLAEDLGALHQAINQ